MPAPDPIDEYAWMLMESPIGWLNLLHVRGRLMLVHLAGTLQQPSRVRDEPALREQMQAYFADGRHAFDLALDQRGTPFQLKVWQALREIPAGETLTYGQLAARLGSSARAVGSACRANTCPIVVPCHRVVGQHGLGGYSGETAGKNLEIKRWLLRHEGVVLD